MLNQILKAAPEIALFAALALGHALGRVKLGSFSLGGVAGSLIVALGIGQFGVTLPDALKAVCFALFIYAVGFKSGYNFTINLALDANDLANGKKLTFKETREFEALELRIAETEKRLPEIDRELAAAASDAGRVHELFLEQQGLNTQLETDLTRWAELAERIEG